MERDTTMLDSIWFRNSVQDLHRQRDYMALANTSAAAQKLYLQRLLQLVSSPPYQNQTNAILKCPRKAWLRAHSTHVTAPAPPLAPANHGEAVSECAAPALASPQHSTAPAIPLAHQRPGATAATDAAARTATRAPQQPLVASGAPTQWHAAASIDKKEVAKFGRLASQWWSASGPFAALHALNAARIHFIREAVAQQLGRDRTALLPFQGLSILDVGCGGGILAEPLARLGGRVLGVDVTEENIGVARCHALQDAQLASNLAYEGASAEALVERGLRFDVVVASEVIEHVRRPPEFARVLAALCAPGGCVVITTLNRTPEAYALAIVAAEKILGMAPDGAHDWNKFLRPEELQLIFGEAGLSMQLLAGMQLDVLGGGWRCTGHTGVNYAAMFAAETSRRSGAA